MGNPEGNKKSSKKSSSSKRKEEKKILTEEEATFYAEWDSKQCLKHLAEFCREWNGRRYVTRNFYRTKTGVADATWNRYFGSFKEFRRQARVELSRQQHLLETRIAKHVSVDHYRKLNERHDYGDNYIRKNTNRFKTILFFSDIHDIEADKFYLRVLLDVAERVQPDVISMVGDIFDFYEFSRYDKDPRNWDPVKRIKFVHESIFRPLRESCPASQMDLIEGNHEARILKHMADATPALRVVLSDLHGWTLQDLMGLTMFEINYVSRLDLAAFNKSDIKKELKKNYRIYFDCVLAHHFPGGKRMGLPGVNGHHHAHRVWQQYSPVFGPYEWHQLGCGHYRGAEYCDGSLWGNGFALCHVDTKTKATSFDYIPITSHAVAGGKWYYRRKDEE